MKTDTIAAIATGLTEAGIGIIRISGQDAIEIADRVFCTKSGKRILMSVESHTLHYGYIVDDKEECPDKTNDLNNIENKSVIDEVMVAVMKAPHSYTAEDTVEINCHGGVLVMRKVLEVVLSHGARLAEPGEFTKRAFLNGRIDLSKAEAVMDVIYSRNEWALASSMSQLKGSLSEIVRKLRAEILYEIAFIESALDDPEHISLDGYQKRILEKLEEILSQIKKLIESADQGKMLKDGINTVIVGRPNVGKSSLMNLMVGEDRSIVTEIAGTTRDVLQESILLHGISLNLKDTAGIRSTEDFVERIGVEKALHLAQDADLLLYMVDSSSLLDENDDKILHFIQPEKTLILFHKSDLAPLVKEEDIYNRLGNRKVKIIRTSVVDHTGMEELENAIEEMFFHGKIKINNEITITNIRHKDLLERAYEDLQMVKESALNGMPEDFYSIDLMSAYEELGEIIGEEVGEDLVNEIFSRFCIGK